jgi:hypothetical protein
LYSSSKLYIVQAEKYKMEWKKDKEIKEAREAEMKTTQTMTLLTCILEVPVSNFDRGTEHVVSGFSCRSAVPTGKCRDSTLH